MTRLKDKPDIRNIPAGQCFADALAQGLLDMTAGNPASLSGYLLLLPSRRAARTLRDSFLRLSGGRAALLPRMHPIGDVDAEEISLLLTGEDANDFPDVPAAVGPLERQILLARLIQSSGAAQSFDQAASLARELGNFLDAVQTENLDFAALDALAPDEFAGHWQKTLEFLKILTQHWPEILKSRGVIDAALRRNLLLEAQVRAWERHPPTGPVIAAGSTGPVPGVRRLMALVARLPQGMVVLPGLDRLMDDDSWAAADEDHPQHAFKKLLTDMQAGRDDVAEWAATASISLNVPRLRLLSEAMRPAETSEQWRRLTSQDIPPQALDGLSRIDCATPQEEADVIALLMRGALETPGRTAALITPDRRLARRVALSLRRWGIRIDDSGGQPLTDLPAGAFLMLTAEAAEEKLSPVTLLALLKHHVLAAAMPAEELRNMVYLLDQAALRGPRPAPGLAGLRAAIAAIDDRRAGDRAPLLSWLETIEPLMQEFLQMMQGAAEVPFRRLMEAHIRMSENLAATLKDSGEARLWRGESGEAASEIMQSLLAAAEDVPPLKPAHYVSLLRTLLKSVTVRPRYGAHPRLSILGQIEARMYCADLVILGGLNEGTWPALPAHNPWMSRPMLKQFGLPSPESILGLAAHDFVQAAAAPEVVMTRAQKVDGTPTVPARWLLRLDTVLHAAGLEMPKLQAAQYRQWLKDIDTPAQPPRGVSRPAPTPPVEARPNKLSVTRIESWMRDPYQIYAQYILNLRAFDPVDADPGGAERGTFIHAALESFVKAHPDRLPPDAVAQLLEFGRAALREMRIPPEVEAFWWPRFERIAPVFIAQESEWRAAAKPFATEAKGAWEFDGFTLTGTADRIDRLGADYAIIDYKSGFVPQKSDVYQGLSPQLPLEAVMLQKGAFKDIPAGTAQELVYWRVTGSGQKPVERIVLGDKNRSVENMMEEAEAGLRALVEKFRDGTTPYLSQPRAEAKPAFSDYAHLARVKEWGLSAEEGDDAE